MSLIGNESILDQNFSEQVLAATNGKSMAIEGD